MSANNNGWVIKWLVGALFSVIIAVISFMGNTVKANDIRNTEDRKNIRAEMKQDKKEVLREIKEISKEQTFMAVKIEKILTLLERDD